MLVKRGRRRGGVFSEMFIVEYIGWGDSRSIVYGCRELRKSYIYCLLRKWGLRIYLFFFFEEYI